MIDGATVFRFMDGEGIPLPLLLDVLRKADTGFDVEGFIVAAKASGNYSWRRLDRILIEESPDSVKPYLRALLVKHYGHISLPTSS